MPRAFPAAPGRAGRAVHTAHPALAGVTDMPAASRGRGSGRLGRSGRGPPGCGVLV